MNELLNQFEKETGNRVDFCGPKIYRDKYVEWLENKLAQKPEVSEEVSTLLNEMRERSKMMYANYCSANNPIEDNMWDGQRMAMDEAIEMVETHMKKWIPAP